MQLIDKNKSEPRLSKLQMKNNNHIKCRSVKMSPEKINEFKENMKFVVKR